MASILDGPKVSQSVLTLFLGIKSLLVARKHLQRLYTVQVVRECLPRVLGTCLTVQTVGQTVSRRLNKLVR